MSVDLPGESPAVPARNRVRVPAGRSYSVNVRLTAENCVMWRRLRRGWG
ncbi:hypothetical protein [Plantactinospora sp. KBS50]|nr:hypothetical protein [Plantactinospora sp. KBS50]